MGRHSTNSFLHSDFIEINIINYWLRIPTTHVLSSSKKEKRGGICHKKEGRKTASSYDFDSEVTLIPFQHSLWVVQAHFLPQANRKKMLMG